MRESHAHTLTTGYQTVSRPVIALPRDPLSQPDNDDLIGAALTMLPQGEAWGSPDGEALSLNSWHAKFVRVLIEPFVWLYARGWQWMLESSVQTLGETLEEWEADHGLPETCLGGDQSREARMTALRRKVLAEPVNHPEDFIRMAAEFGFTIEIEEPCLFECGFSECGGDHEAGPQSEETTVIVRIRDASISYFECGFSECGHDPLFSLGEIEGIVCLLQKTLPAWVSLVIEDWITLAPLVTEAGNPIIDEYGNHILVRVYP